ncbi:hypothetical protein M758_4G080600 [Ceratodon purpureus]|uniref:LIMR family protein n=1 Tax=Ceratodon purpureus TaxID=3225 RepID=A0A8T0I7X7_CERPU|nr:hypothetical protein KC19_4G079800 [Ceratodon purpureus]KAG0579186.1 hypothetical protein KC19_4G079800 [Ceratodon purpureus]KAG0579187.1 hypothetical protein KC19_4G079800 [Ceratodon purpureus]KAG0618639.1 hypothetical protein M758_4G080600 [Ceratodon purpureus]
MGDYNVVLLLIVVVVTLMVLAFNMYLLVNYQHPDDWNQAWFPKVVVILGLSVAQLSILMLPADIANKHACRHSVYTDACSYTLPMRELWYTVYIIDAVLVFFVIPFSVFYYEGDQEKSWLRRACGAIVWVLVTAMILGIVLGVVFALVGKVDFDVQRLESSAQPYTADFNLVTSRNPCLPTNQDGTATRVSCSAEVASPESATTWTMRTSFPEYVIAILTIVGSVLFSVFGGVGIACLPLSLIFGYIRRPKAIITRPNYIKEATELGKRAKEIKDAAQALQREERAGNKGRKWKKNVNKVKQELMYLEEDERALEEVYPQGEKADTSWALTVLGYLGGLLFGVIGLLVSIVWVVHIIVYMLITPPSTPFLNWLFIRLDNTWGLLGTLAFAFFCCYLLLAVISGEMQLGLNFMLITIHPMKLNGTLMSSFLVNVGLILVCSISVIQFCSKAFALYAQATAVQEIFGPTLESLRGIKYLFKYNVFQYAFLVCAGLATVYYLAFGWRKRNRPKFQLE